MISYLSECIADLYIRRNIILENEKNVYKCGVELILNETFTFLLVIFFSAIIGKFIFAVEFLTVFCFTRIFCGGFHAKTTSVCRMTMILTFFEVWIFSELLEGTKTYIIYLILFASFIVLLPLIPVKHPNKKMSEEIRRKNKIRGIFAYVFFSVCAIIMFTLEHRQSGLIIALSLVSVSVLAIVGTFTGRGGEKNEEIYR